MATLAVLSQPQKGGQACHSGVYEPSLAGRGQLSGWGQHGSMGWRCKLPCWPVKLSSLPGLMQARQARASWLPGLLATLQDACVFGPEMGFMSCILQPLQGELRVRPGHDNVVGVSLASALLGQRAPEVLLCLPLPLGSAMQM